MTAATLGFLGFLPFSLFVTSLLSTKLLHIYIHHQAISLFSLLIFLPTLLLPDILISFGVWLLCCGHRGMWALLGSLVMSVISIITYGAASMSLGFFFRTGGEVEWKTSLAFASDPKGMVVLMSEAQSTIVPAITLLLISWVVRPVVFTMSNAFVAWYSGLLRKVRLYVLPYLKSGYTHAAIEETPDSRPYQDSDQSDHDSLSDDTQFMESEKQPEAVGSLLVFYGKEYLRQKLSPALDSLKHYMPQWKEYLQRGVPSALSNMEVRIVDLGPAKEHLQRRMRSVRASTELRVVIIFAILYITRPSKPYNHLSNTLPTQMLTMFGSGSTGGCHIHTGSIYAEWPFPELIIEEHWIQPDGNFKGWAPGAPNELSSAYKNRTPDWLSDIPPDGFYRWQAIAQNQDPPIDVPDRESARPGGTLGASLAKEECADLLEQLVDYNPVDDPLKITNLDQDPLRPLRKVLKERQAVINHVFVITLESTRMALFPLVPGSDAHKMILKTHSKDQWDEINEKLEHVGRNAQKITGHFDSFTDAEVTEDRLDESDEGFGGINVNGALTGSTFSSKSFVGSHCGVWALPVTMLEETYSQIYQPCLPHILNLFNNGKTDEDSDPGSSIELVERQWKSVFLQSITADYDRQNQLNKQIGFDERIVKETIEEEPGFDEEEINYYGYPERAIKPHMRMALQEAIDKDQRLFLSHFTSTTHHPWATPKDFEDIDYMGEDGHADFNQHLNAIRFQDEWLGEIMELLEELGVANETLMVFVGDHGTAFETEDGSQAGLGPHENKHISNWHVPLAFRHPQLPRIQLDINATSISILPTILDLMIQTDSLNDRDKGIASDLLHDYEGQSMIRPYVKSQEGRRAWNFGIVNPGGGTLLMTSADAPWKLAIPIDSIREFSFVDLLADPLDLEPMDDWVFENLLRRIRNEYGKQAEKWAMEAEKISKYFVDRQHRLWKYADQL